MKTAMKNKRYFLLSIAALLVILMAGCANSADSEPSVTVAGDPVISESSNEETVSTSATAIESKAETTAEETTSESTIKEFSTEETANEIPNDTSIEVTDTTEGTVAPSATEATSAELTAPATLDASKDSVQLNLDNVKQSYDTSYGSEIACATFVLNYLGFNVDEATLASYLPPSDDSLSYIPSSAIRSSIENYFSDVGVQEYQIKEDYLLLDFNYFDGYPSIVWMVSSDSSSQQCFVLVGHHMVDFEHYYYLLYDPVDNTVEEYGADSVSQTEPDLDLIVRRK